MRRKWVTTAFLCAILSSPLAAQNGPDSDPDGASGYVRNLFHGGSADSVNLYNGQITIPISVGPRYPIGPSLTFQALLTYTSTVWEFGNPGPDFQSDVGLYEPIKGDPSIAIGWSLHAGAIKPCGVVQNSQCYVSPDGAEHLFDVFPAASYFKTSDAGQLLLHFLGPAAGYEMWDGDGNRYVFSWHVTGYDDPPQNYLNDFGRGRNGWYLTSLTDVFGNGISVSYYANLGAQPCWTPSHCPVAVNSWIPHTVQRGATTLATIHLGSDPGAPGIGNLITSIDFAVPGGTVATWTVGHGTVSMSRGQPNTASVALVTLNALKLPTAPTPQYSFDWNSGAGDGGFAGLLKTMTLPTGGVVSYVWGAYSFYHGRTASLSINCSPLGPPNNADVKQSGRPAAGVKTNLPGTEMPLPLIAGTDCSLQNPNRWLDGVHGLIRRTETYFRADGMGVDAVTDYAQYAFPFGEQGSVSQNLGPQTLTFVAHPADVDGHRTATATLFWGSPRGSSGSGIPGDHQGADIRVASYDHDPYPGVILPFPQPLCGSAADALCVTHAARVRQRAFDYDNPTGEAGNRRLKTETTYFAATNADGSCPGCASHTVAFSSSTGAAWETEGRHYNVETHSGNLGGDARSITTDWDPQNWNTMPAAGLSPLPNLVKQRTEAQGASVRDLYLEYDTATGFRKGSFVFDAPRGIAFLECRYPDAAGALDKEFTKTFGASSTPPRTYCSSHYPSFPASVGLDGDAFGKDTAHQNGQLSTARWINGSVATSTFFVRNLARDAATGWVTSSTDTDGLATTYAYDLLGRVIQISPPAAELKTWICYDGPNATTAYRAAAQQTCPVSPGNGFVSTWEHRDYDGFGRAIRVRRLLPATQVSKRFTLWDAAGHGYFESEWVADSTAEAVSANLATACVFGGGNVGTARPSSAPGTYRMCFDPFGRPQQVVESKHSSLATVDRTDGASPYSETVEATLTYCVNATFSNLQAATCSPGGLNSLTTSRRDAFGRVTRVAEPTGEATTYAYDVNGKLTLVTQGVQNRAFGYDAAGFARSETTPEAGTTTHDSIGSLGNLRQETLPGEIVVTRTYDFAGRLTEQDAGGSKFLVNCYDGAAACADGGAGYSGGSYPGGKLTRRYGYNFLPTMGPILDERFEYSGAGGRLSRQTTTAGNGDFSSTASQAWSYNSLGLISTHGHPRPSGTLNVTSTYGAGLIGTIASGGVSVVAATTYNPAAALASWKAGNSGAPVTTTIVPDASLLPRPGSISNSLWSSGSYTYDSTGNVLKIGSTDIYGYDARSRLTSASFSGASRGFSYDRYGNLTSSGAAAFDVDPVTNHLRPTNPGAPAYDARGELVSYNGEALAYDAIGRQYRDTNSSGDWVFLYNGAGERIVKFPARFSVLRREMARYIAEANAIAKGWVQPACVQVFTDVPCSDPDAAQIKLVYDKGITAGCNTNPLRYCPDATLTRAQVSIFVVKGSKPDGFVPPVCQGTFQDVTCSGPYASFAPWIEQLYRDGITSGCSSSPLQFCPASTVGEWEMLVWLAKAPGPAPGTFFWSAYHPVPRGSIYTWRDEQNRVVTEATGGTTGAATAALPVARDNVFLGNLLVASYVASPPGWQYTASDHLGSPRVVFNQSGQLVETHKFWPYGEDTNVAPPNQHLAFCLMERDDGAAHYYDHARTHDHFIGRFTSPDRVGGHPVNPQSWNRYAYTLGNPLKHVDPDGRLTILVHGTWADGNPHFQPGGQFFSRVAGSTHDRAVASFGWSGNDTTGARASAAQSLASFVRHYKFAPGETLNIIAHSHGGNVAIAAANIGLGRQVDNLVTLGTPVRPDYQLKNGGSVANFIALSDIKDPVQTVGGGQFNSPLFGEWGPADRWRVGATNLLGDFGGDFPSRKHSELYKSEDAWDLVLSHLHLPERNPWTDQLNLWVHE